MKLRHFAFQVLASLFLASTFAPSVSISQDLKDELDALEDFPENDLSSSGSGGGKATPKAAPADDLDSGLDAVDPPKDTVADKAKALPKEQTESLPDDLDSLGSDTGGAEGDALAVSEPKKKAEPTPQPSNPTESLTGVDSEAQGTIKVMSFRQLTDRVRLILRSDRPVDYAREIRSQRRQVILEMRNTHIGNSVVKRALDTGEFDGPVALVQAFDSKAGSVPSVKVLFQLRQLVDPKITRNGNDLFVDFNIQGAGRLFRTHSNKKQVEIPETVVSIDANSRYKGARISLNVKNQDLSDFLSMLSGAAGKNFVLAGGAGAAKVTMNVQNIPWDQALAIVLLNNKLGYQQIGNIYRIMPIADLKGELSEAVATAANIEDASPLETRMIPISYAKAGDISNGLNDFKSKRGKITVDARTNSVIVTDTAEVLDRMAIFVKSIDTQTAQVEIQARIVEARHNFTTGLNIDWKVGEFTGDKFSSSFVNVGNAGSALQGTPTYDQLAATGTQGGMRLRVGNLGNLGAIQAVLGFAEQEDKAKVIASPRITVLDNQAATISQGISLNTATPSATGGPASITTVSANLSLNVTPQVTSDGFVYLQIGLTRDEPTGTGSNTSTRQANTKMLVESGKTAVVGGIYVLDKREGESGWPLFRSLPIFGTLFRNSKSDQTNSNELLMFISPRILNTDKTALSYKEAGNEELRSSKADKNQGDDLSLGDDLL